MILGLGRELISEEDSLDILVRNIPASGVSFSSNQVLYKNQSPTYRTPIVEVFSTVGTSQWVCPEDVNEIDYLVIAGGGAGGDRYTVLNQNWCAGGGGAGGLLRGSANVQPGSTYTIIVGAGGHFGNGNNSSLSGDLITTITSIGGGMGSRDFNAYSGGSGGGAGNNIVSPGAGTSPQGYRGGYGYTQSGPDYKASGGGGGASGVGGNASNGYAGSAGPGLTLDISGSPVTYCVGGQGGTQYASGASYGSYGSGGGGAIQQLDGIDGTQGVIIIRYWR